MSNVSIAAALRTPKVSQAYANNVQSERFQDARFSVAPTRYMVDQYGRPVNRNSLNDTGAGISDPMQRIDIENCQRPNYHPYLSVRQGLLGSAAGFGGYDTLGVDRTRVFDQEMTVRKSGSLDQQQSMTMNSNYRAYNVSK